MTWKEIKEKIEAGGVTDDMEMWYIDIGGDWDICVTPQVDSEGFSVSNI
jgi:hypothetical protein